MSKEAGRFGSFKEEVTDLIIKRALTPRELSVLLYVHCKTISWPKSPNELQFKTRRRVMSRDTKIDPDNLLKTIKVLKKKSWLLECPDDDDYYYYALNPKAFKTGLIIPPKSPVKAKPKMEEDRSNQPDTQVESTGQRCQKNRSNRSNQPDKPVQAFDTKKEFEPSVPSSSPFTNTTVSHNGGEGRASRSSGAGFEEGREEDLLPRGSTDWYKFCETAKLKAKQAQSVEDENIN